MPPGSLSHQHTHRGSTQQKAFSFADQAQTGQMHRRGELVAAFTQALPLQLQCDKDDQGRNVLSQRWFTLNANQLGSFPQKEAFVNTPDGKYEDNGTQPFLMPGWRG